MRSGSYCTFRHAESAKCLSDLWRSGLVTIGRRKYLLTINEKQQFYKLREIADRFGLLSFAKVRLIDIASVVYEEQSLVSVKGISPSSNMEPDITEEIDGRENGHIFVSLKTSEDCAIFSVKEDGIGIEKDETELIWRHFYRFHKSRSGVDGSLGLGLAMSKQLPYIHGASLTVVSEPGK